MTKTNDVSFEQYKAAADRIRRGTPRLGDEALCDRYDAQQVAVVRHTSLFELEVTRRCWRADAKDTGK